jgi:hypothetical protein
MIDGGKVRPRAFAARMFRISSNLVGLLDRQVGGLGALEGLVHIGGGAPVQIKRVWAIGHETAGLRVLRQPVH